MATESHPADWIHPQVMIPELLRRAPSARAVLDKYGLRGCGGALGPHESLATFARAHDVPLEPMLAELRQAAVASLPPVVTPSRDDRLADSIYRPFFLAGIGVTLTLGAAWGVLLLLRIAVGGSFTAVTLHEVNAHGHAQIFGWVGLFVMGFAYQAFPRFKHTDLAHPRLAWASWFLLLTGLVGRSVLEPLADGHAAIGSWAVAASALEIAAIALFAGIIAATLRRAGRRLESYDYYILASLVWFVVQAVWETVYLAATLAAPDRQHLLALIATWQGPMRDVQIHGFAMLMILGVSQRILHYFFGLPVPSPRKSVTALVVLNAAIVGEVLGLVLMGTAGHAWAALWYGSVLALAVAAAVLVADWRIFSRPHESDRSLKFLRAAYVWLFISLGMLVLLPVYQLGLLPALAPQSQAAQIGFSHAYYGAIRHAITVGFISLMIVGVAAKVVPTLRGIDVRRLGGLWAPLVLINLGCGLRVVFQTLTDFSPTAYPIAGASGLFELTGLAIWGIHLARVMFRPAEYGGPAVVMEASPGRDRPITGDDYVGEVLERCSWLLETFVAAGFTPLRNAAIRRTAARRTTIRRACGMLGVDLASFLETLNAACDRPREPQPPAAGSPPDGACGSVPLVPLESITTSS